MVEHTGQTGNDDLIFPGLPSAKYKFGEAERIRIVTPDNQVIVRYAEFAIPFDIPSRDNLMLIPNTQKDEVPIGSQIGIDRSLSEVSNQGS